MTLNRSILVLAGAMVLLSVLLTVWEHAAFAWLTVLIGLNLIQSPFTGSCPAARVFRAPGVKPGCAF